VHVLQWIVKAEPLNERGTAIGLAQLGASSYRRGANFSVGNATAQLNAGKGEAGPVFEIPVELVRSNFETNAAWPVQ
jgi:hypothetical protein